MEHLVKWIMKEKAGYLHSLRYNSNYKCILYLQNINHFIYRTFKARAACPASDRAFAMRL
jgi:hypothetical protein